MKRDTVCESLQRESTQCIEDATIQFILQREVTEIPAEETKPDYRARKTCNYLTATTQDCLAKLLENCIPPGGDRVIIKKKDEVTKKTLKVAEESDLNFDPQKCPITKDYLERNSGKSLTASLLLLIVSLVFCAEHEYCRPIY